MHRGLSDNVCGSLSMSAAGHRSLFKQLPHSLALVDDLQKSSSGPAKVKCVTACQGLSDLMRCCLIDLEPLSAAASCVHPGLL